MSDDFSHRQKTHFVTQRVTSTLDTDLAQRKALYPGTLTYRVRAQKKKRKADAFGSHTLHQFRTDTRRPIHSGVKLNRPHSALDSTANGLHNSPQRLGRDAMRLTQGRIGPASDAFFLPPAAP